MPAPLNLDAFRNAATAFQDQNLRLNTAGDVTKTGRGDGSFDFLRSDDKTIAFKQQQAIGQFLEGVKREYGADAQNIARSMLGENDRALTGREVTRILEALDKEDPGGQNWRNNRTLIQAASTQMLAAGQSQDRLHPQSLAPVTLSALMDQAYETIKTNYGNQLSPQEITQFDLQFFGNPRVVGSVSTYDNPFAAAVSQALNQASKTGQGIHALTRQEVLEIGSKAVLSVMEAKVKDHIGMRDGGPLLHEKVCRDAQALRQEIRASLPPGEKLNFAELTDRQHEQLAHLQGQVDYAQGALLDMFRGIKDGPYAKSIREILDNKALSDEQKIDRLPLPALSDKEDMLLASRLRTLIAENQTLIFTRYTGFDERFNVDQQASPLNAGQGFDPYQDMESIKSNVTKKIRSDLGGLIPENSLAMKSKYVGEGNRQPNTAPLVGLLTDLLDQRPDIAVRFGVLEPQERSELLRELAATIYKDDEAATEALANKFNEVLEAKLLKSEKFESQLNEANKLGQGSFGTAYSVADSHGAALVVKQIDLNKISMSGITEGSLIQEALVQSSQANNLHVPKIAGLELAETELNIFMAKSGVDFNAISDSDEAKLVAGFFSPMKDLGELKKHQQDLLVGKRKIELLEMVITGQETYAELYQKEGMDAILPWYSGHEQNPDKNQLNEWLDGTKQAISTVESEIKLIQEKIDNGMSALIEGETLKNFEIAKNKQSCLAFHLASGMTKALEPMHQRGMVHCDLKPANVVLDRNTLEPRLIDFGTVARAEKDTGWGSPAFMPPERPSPIQAGLALPAGDIYAIGVSMFNTVTGLLFGSAEVYAEALNSSLWDSSEAMRDAKAFISACIRTAPYQRPTTEQILQAIRGEPVTPGQGTKDNPGLTADELGVLAGFSPEKGYSDSAKSLLAQSVRDGRI